MLCQSGGDIRRLPYISSTWAGRCDLKEKNGRPIFWSKSLLFLLPKQVLEWALLSKLQIKLTIKKDCPEPLADQP